MWKNYILALFLGFTLIIVTYFINLSSDNIAVNVKDVVSNESCKVTEINKEEEKYVVKAYMPVTGVDILDDKVSSIYNKIIEDFIKETESLELLGNDKKFTLTINFNDTVDQIETDDASVQASWSGKTATFTFASTASNPLTIGIHIDHGTSIDDLKMTGFTYSVN